MDGFVDSAVDVSAGASSPAAAARVAQGSFSPAVSSSTGVDGVLLESIMVIVVMLLRSYCTNPKSIERVRGFELSEQKK